MAGWASARSSTRASPACASPPTSTSSPRPRSILRITLPKDTGRLEILVKVARRDPHGFGVSFLTLGEGEAERIAPFVAPGDIRRWARRVTVSLPVRIEAGTGEGDVIHGRTVDLSTSGARLTTDGSLSVSDVVVVELPGSRDRRDPAAARAGLGGLYRGRGGGLRQPRPGRVSEAAGLPEPLRLARRLPSQREIWVTVRGSLP